MIARRLLAAGPSGGAFTTLPVNLKGLINAAVDNTYVYTIGPFSSSDGGATFTVGSGATITHGTGWESTYVKDPYLVWDGSQYVCYYTGFDGTNMRIGRATASAIDGTWTKYGSNPVLTLGSSGQFDEYRINFPVVVYSATESPPWKMWYAGWTPPPADIDITIGFADSTDGISWTKRGQVLDLGPSGHFDDAGVIPGTVIKVGSTWYLLYTGFRSDIYYSGGYATCTDPADSGTYVRGAEWSNYAGNLTFGGKTWRSNQPRNVLRYGDQYLILGSAWNPTAGGEEGAFAVFSSDLTNPPAPTGLLLPLGSGWDANTAENPSALWLP